MKKVFTSPDSLAAQSVAAFLVSNEVRIVVRGEERQSVSGLIPPTDCWLEVFVVNQEDEERAATLLAEFSRRNASGSIWRCLECGEELETQFTDCWKCQPKFKSVSETEGPIVKKLTTWVRILISLHLLIKLSRDWVAGLYLIGLPIVARQISHSPSYDYVKRFSGINDVIYGMTFLSLFGLLLFWNIARYTYLFALVSAVVFTAIVYDVTNLSRLEVAYLSIESAIGVAIILLIFWTALSRKFEKNPGSGDRRPAGESYKV